MSSLRDQLGSYAAYHQDLRNKLTHFVGVPLVTFSLFLFLSWFRFMPTGDLPMGFFPIGVWDQPTGNFDTWKQRGINTLVQYDSYGGTQSIGPSLP